MHIILYSTNCPKCQILERLLNEQSVDFSINNDIDEIQKIGEKNKILEAPILQVDDDVLSFSQAIKWLKERVSK